jgi:hypothetical protein
MAQPMKSVKLPNPVIPTYDPRHSSGVRLGKQSAEIFCKNNKRREELGLYPIPDPKEFQ